MDEPIFCSYRRHSFLIDWSWNSMTPEEYFMCHACLSGWMPSSHLLRWTVFFFVPEELGVDSGDFADVCLLISVGFFATWLACCWDRRRICFIFYNHCELHQKIDYSFFSILPVPFFFLRISCPCLKSNSRKALTTPQAPALRLWCQPMPTTCWHYAGRDRSGSHRWDQVRTRPLRQLIFSSLWGWKSFG